MGSIYTLKVHVLPHFLFPFLPHPFSLSASSFLLFTMFSRAIAVLFVLGLSSVVCAQDDVAAKVAQLRSATTAVERIKLLSDDEVRGSRFSTLTFA